MTSARVSQLATRWPLLVALLYFGAHLPFLASSPEDIDSINFALGLHHFDVSLHQPHPPGYPVYILLGRVSLWLVSKVSSVSAVHADALALAIWSALGGAVAIGGAARLFAAVERRFGGTSASPLWPVLLMAASPLFWMCGLRPMSDMPGLAAVLWSQALLVEGMRDRRAFILGALVSGLAAGIRIQTLALTSPVFLVALVAHYRAGLWWLASRPVLATVAGLLTWAVPLTIASGGVSAYLAALNTQAGEDFAWVNMLWSNPTARRLAFALNETFALPWASTGLARVVLAFSAIGGLIALVRAPRTLAFMLFAFVPYIVYHLLLQETITVRYALPAIPLVAWCASRVVLLGRRAPVVVGALTAAALVVAVQGGVVYGREAHPAYRALEDASRAASTTSPARVYAHYGLRRSLQHGGSGLPFVEPTRQYEWLGPLDYWREGGQGEVWFFGDPKRTDLALIDPVSLGSRTRYVWSAERRGELSGTRPMGVDWYRASVPEWFLGEGWSLTPEAGGMTRATARGPDHRPIEAWIRRRAEPMVMMIGGFHLGGPGDADANLSLSIENSTVDSWSVSGAEGSFLRFIPLPAGVPLGATPYGTLRVVSDVVAGGRRPEVAIRQFDVRPATGLVWGFGQGWHEAEYSPETGVQWRWTSDHAVVELRGTPQQARLTLTGESPLKYFDSPPTVRVTSQGRTLAEARPDKDFSLTIELPLDIWRAGAASVAIDVDKVYLPGQAEGTGDVRRLGIRVFDARIDTSLR